MRLRSLLPNVVLCALLVPLLAQAAPGVARAADPARPGRTAETELERQEMERRVLLQIQQVGDAVHASIERLLDERLARLTTTQCIAIAGTGPDCAAPALGPHDAPASPQGM